MNPWRWRILTMIVAAYFAGHMIGEAETYSTGYWLGMTIMGILATYLKKSGRADDPRMGRRQGHPRGDHR